MSHRVRVGLAGLGRMGRIHAASPTTRCPSAELACVFDADTDLAGQVAAEFGVDRAAEQSWRSGRTVTVAAARTQDGVRYTVKQESR
jgi:predicted dehydrogenase